LHVLELALTLLALCSAALLLLAEYANLRRLAYVCKPLATSAILLLALLAPRPVAPSYRLMIGLGLAFSLAGDILLMLPSDRFLAGLICFLAAHLCYVAAFSSVAPAPTLWAAMPFLLYGLITCRLLWPYLVKMRLPVLGYATAIMVMCWRALAMWAQTGRAGAALAVAGATLFAASDTALALRRFRGEYAGAQALILSTYYLGQWLIARSA
jgi:uncharacterized membrane protein YhhN